MIKSQSYIAHVRKTDNQAVYYAHSGKLEDLSDGQTLLAHLSKVSEIAEQNAQWFGAKELAKYAGLLHDLGKYCPEFQRRLQGGKIRVDHATAGAQVAAERWQLIGKLLAYCIAGHHAGLANGIDEGEQRSNLEVRLKLEPGKDIPHLDPIWEQEIKLPEQLKPPVLKLHKTWQGFQFAFFTRMIFHVWLMLTERIPTTITFNWKVKITLTESILHCSLCVTSSM